MNSTNPLIYVVEDEEDLGKLICTSLENYRYQVQYCGNGAQLFSALAREQPEICIVDLNLPDIDGMQLVKELELRAIGVIIVSGRDGLTDRVLGLEFGADDYITKPFEPRELVARVQSLHRRLEKQIKQSEQVPKQALFASWTFQPESLSLSRGEHSESLSRAEGDMLLALLKHPFQILSRDQLLGENCVPYDRSIDVRMSRLRKKVESDPQHPELIKTVYGAGYMLTTEVKWM